MVWLLLAPVARQCYRCGVHVPLPQLLNDVKGRLSSLMAEGSQLRASINCKQQELDGFESDFHKTATQSSQAAAGFKKLQAQQKDA